MGTAGDKGLYDFAWQLMIHPGTQCTIPTLLPSPIARLHPWTLPGAHQRSLAPAQHHDRQHANGAGLRGQAVPGHVAGVAGVTAKGA